MRAQIIETIKLMSIELDVPIVTKNDPEIGILIFINDKLYDVIPVDGTHKDRHPITFERLDSE